MRKPNDKQRYREELRLAKRRVEIHAEITKYKLTNAHLDGITYNGRKGYFKSDRFKLEYQRDINDYKLIRIGDYCEHEHRLAFRLLGIDISGKDIHHRNEVRHDNCFTNLVAMSPRDHADHHRRERAAREQSDRKQTPINTEKQRFFCQP